jgi:catechol 2,3-dioxygenase-like lactoylglutathione lyase family enzyme
MRFEAPFGLVAGFGDTALPKPYFWLSPGTATEPRHESHLAFAAASRAQVDEVGAAATAAGLEILHAPRVWPEYHPTYYAVFFRDLDGNNIEAVCHTPE